MDASNTTGLDLRGNFFFFFFLQVIVPVVGKTAISSFQTSENINIPLKKDLPKKTSHRAVIFLNSHMTRQMELNQGGGV